MTIESDWIQETVIVKRWKKTQSNFLSQGEAAFCRSFHHCEGLRSLIRTLEARQPHRGENKQKENLVMEQTPERQGQSCILKFTAEILFFVIISFSRHPTSGFKWTYNSFGLLSGKHSGGDGSKWRESASEASPAKSLKSHASHMRHFNFTTVISVWKISFGNLQLFYI